MADGAWSSVHDELRKLQCLSIRDDRSLVRPVCRYNFVFRTA